MPETLTSIVNDAVAAEDKKTTSVTETAPTAVETTDKKETPAAPEFSEEDLTNAKLVWKTLKDGGEGAQFFIDALAQKNGYAKIETKQEAKELKSEIKDEITEALGEDYPDLVIKLGPAIDKYVARKLEEGTADLKSSITANEQEKLEARSEATFTKISNDFYDGKEVPNEVDTEMAKLMGRYKPDVGQNIEEYVMDIFHMATAKLGKLPLPKASRTAAEAAKRNAPAILDASKGRPTPSSEGTSPREKGMKMNLNDSVAAAIAEVNKQMEKS
jgi:hypothetical protein